ncbi:MAG: class I SAM-dependent methyltransferase [Clostridiales bacterium]|jgi:hypothetical protein|nr:class I SAM-dependent methyltransferase [Clostridiales bacterium]
MKIPGIVYDALSGKGVNGSIYGEFPVPPVSRIEIRPNLIYRLCAEKRVIHLGCTDHLPLIDQRIAAGNYIHRQLSYVASECIGVDINAEAVAHVHKRGIGNVVVGDITKPGIKEIESGRWDWIVIPDVIEHIPNPAAFLQAMDAVYGKYISRILITVPNAYGNYLGGMTQFAKEVINYDHCFWFTPYTICKVVHAAGLEIDELFMCSYENPSDAIRAKEQSLKEYPLLMNTVALTAHSRGAEHGTS